MKGNYARFLVSRSKYEDAVVWAQAALSQRDFLMARFVLADAHASLAINALTRGDESTCAAQVDKALRASPKRSHAQYALGMYRRQTGDPKARPRPSAQRCRTIRTTLARVGRSASADRVRRRSSTPLPSPGPTGLRRTMLPRATLATSEVMPCSNATTSFAWSSRPLPRSPVRLASLRSASPRRPTVSSRPVMPRSDSIAT